MSRTAARITQADVARAIRAAQQCGAEYVEIRPDGAINVVQHGTQPREQIPVQVAFDPLYHPGFVYFVGGGPFIKIGWSSSIPERLAALQTGNPYKLVVLASCIGSIDTERELHERFKIHRAEGEWFRDCQEIRGLIEEMQP